VSVQRKYISGDDANALVVSGQSLVNFYIYGIFDLGKGDLKYLNKVEIINCQVEFFSAATMIFAEITILKDSHFFNCTFNFAYFLKGLTIDNCKFDSYLDFEGGGHNDKESIFLILNSKFDEFVNFCDCWFIGNVQILNNTFTKGTNILGNIKKPCGVEFDRSYLVEDNIGNIDVNGEGDKGVNYIREIT
jgi:hypothetical protein